MTAHDIAWGAEVEFYPTPSQMDSLGAAALDAATTVVVYRDGADSGHGKAKVILPFVGGDGPLPKVVFSKWYVGAEAPLPATTTVPPTTSRSS